MSRRLRRRSKQPKQHNGVYDTEFVVESILDRRIDNGAVQYKIKWKDYPVSQCTWEPLCHLTNVEDMIASFEYQQIVKERTKEVGEKSVGKTKVVVGDLELDVPAKVMSARKIAGKILCMVEWKRRLDGVKPQNSELLADDLKEDYYNLLLDFYESRITFN
eukprot:TRINITY_DN7056_c0_g2_i1.p2 TRINITY_DN7056_c0_g2~~TRINITY_DN7056_c0_g2_i1.p2  ORF type:complete len:161 (+),score=61.11 TRINITY_DN7056_c0_g2_i1:202-684(+)